jgi:hypothetical protein
VNDELEVHVVLQTERNSTVSSLHKLRGYTQGLLIEADYVMRMNKLPFSVKRREWGQASSWVPERSQPNVMETRLNTDTREQPGMTMTR